MNTPREPKMRCHCPRSEWRPGDKRLHSSFCEIGRKEEAEATKQWPRL